MLWNGNIGLKMGYRIYNQKSSKNKLCSFIMQVIRDCKHTGSQGGLTGDFILKKGKCLDYRLNQVSKRQMGLFL